jgi:hypothetical protein
MANVKLKNYLQDPKIKPGPTHKLKAMNSFDQNIDTTQNPEYTYLKLLIPLTPSVEKTMNIHHRFK